MQSNSKHNVYSPALRGETQLLQQLKAGSHAAFDALYQHYEPRLRLFLYPFVKDDIAVLNTILQDVFVKLWLKKEDLAGIEFLEFYLQRMAKNRLLDVLKLRNIREKHEAILAEIQTNTDRSTEEQLQLKEYMQVAQEAISKLPDRRRIIFSLNVLDGFSLDEIAAALQLSKEVVKKQLAKSKVFLRRYIEQKGDLRQSGRLLLMLDLL